MMHRFFGWLIAGAVTAGMSACMLLGAGVAVAEPGQDRDHGASTETSNPEASNPGTPKTTDAEANGRRSSRGSDEDDEAVVERSEAEADETEVADETETEERSPRRTKTDTTEKTDTVEKADTVDTAETTDLRQRAPVEAEHAVPEAEPAESTEPTSAAAEDTAEPVESAEPAPQADAAEPAVVEERSATRPVSTARAFAAPEPTPGGPTLVNIIGTAFFAVFDLVTKILEGPPAVPAGSSVTVGRSTLEIDCGDGYTADADWYFPDTDEPAGIIYFQHGGFARAGFYNVTAAELAERTDSIVVAPSITGNLFACDSCHTGGDQMHFAVAKLFSGDRAALQASADAAAGHPVVLPRRYILSGHSAGGQLAAGAGGYAAQIAQATGLPLELAGVLLMDTSETGGAVSRGLTKIPLDVPVLYIAEEPAVLNDFGSVEGVLNVLRPNLFQGVRIIGGVHNDAFQSSNPIAQIGGSLLFGVSQPQNVEALQILAQGWIADMYAGTVYDEDARTGLYGSKGSVMDIPTGTASAHGHVLPGPPRQLNFFDSIQKALLDSTATLRFGYCAADIEAELDQMSQSPSGDSAMRRGFGCA